MAGQPQLDLAPETATTAADDHAADASHPNPPEPEGPADHGRAALEMLRDVELNVRIELGRTRMAVGDVLNLDEGSVVELDRLAGDPVDVFVNDRLVARGEVLVLDEKFCV